MSENPTMKQTILEDGTEFDGSIKSKCPITVSGKLKGEVSAPSLTITVSGSVHGQVKVSQLKSQGEIAGEIDAESVELSGRVSDQTTIRATTLEVMLNQAGSGSKLQVTFGNCELQVGERTAKPISEPAKAALLDNGKKEQPKSEPVPAIAGVKVEPKPTPAK
ncbi:MAG: polymer-forming cytoskeletal protein [Acidobacteriota bacterium]